MQSNLVLQRAEPGRGEVMFFRVVPASSLSLHLRPVIQTTKTMRRKKKEEWKSHCRFIQEMLVMLGKERKGNF
jgi:hypothetical protein